MNVLIKEIVNLYLNIPKKWDRAEKRISQIFSGGNHMANEFEFGSVVIFI